MEHNKIMNVLLCVLALSCAVVGCVIFLLRREILYLPDKAADDLISVLEESGITVEPGLVGTKRERGVVYVCTSEDYSAGVAALLCPDGVKYTFASPEGDIIISQKGERIELGENFSIKYSRGGEVGEMSAPRELSEMSLQPSEKKSDEIVRVVSEFLSGGNEGKDGLPETEIVAESIREDGGRYYALCTRSIDGAEIIDNRILCVIEDGVVTEASGSWCFLSPGEKYSARLCDIVNILFNVKKEIGEDTGEVKITEVGLCFSLYSGGEGGFCLIPCWRVVTDTAGEFIYNAIDSTLYTKRQ